ncbi:hypothetical protein PsYK624_130210 [Phanerochaete sordida]|uniref:Nephrocystin 3-like N-terminal domain-containing protein n=1 Tax=Phanerochaete sordida TaxID=48140 RepID=A0A9P3GKC9_9APHY|nr:hypothetical protein PsYK624_130210 [Phanerochaete sordida]
MSYVPDSPSDRRIIEERLLYLPMVRALEDATFPELAQTAKKMVKVLDYIVGYMTFEDIVLDRFLGHASALRKTLQRTQQKIDTSKWSYSDGTQINPASRNEVRSMISSSEELRERGRDLLRAIGLVKKRAKGLRRPKGSRSYRLSSSIFRTKEDGNTILEDMADMVEVAQAAFETRASIDIVECIANIVNRQQRKDQFQLAEKFAGFIERVTSGAGSAHSAGQAQRRSVEAIPMEQNIAIDMERWLSSEKRVYCLSGEPGTGKTRIAIGLCGLLSSELAPRATLGASFFISHGNKDLRSFRFALLSISHQVSPRSRANLLGIP